MKEYELKMVLSNHDNKYSSDEILDMFIAWAEEKELKVGGSIHEIE